MKQLSEGTVISTSEGQDISLDLIDLPMDIEGFKYFLTSWLVRDHERDVNILIDTGPSSTVELLFQYLEALDIEKIDLILLTHIHMDHAGGCGHVSRRFPDANIIVSERGIKHLADPSRLWESSLETIGETALKYGPMIPVDRSRINCMESLTGLPIVIMPTPGHASHHNSYGYGKILFAGEAAGAHVPFNNVVPMDSVWTSTPDICFPYIRPATPPPFQFDTAWSSVEKLFATEGFEILCYAHYGFSFKLKEMLSSFREQLLLWKFMFSENFSDDTDNSEDRFISDCFDQILERDPFLANFRCLSESVQNRERFFISNSIRGFSGAFKSFRLHGGK